MMIRSHVMPLTIESNGNLTLPILLTGEEYGRQQSKALNGLFHSLQKTKPFPKTSYARYSHRLKEY